MAYTSLRSDYETFLRERNKNLAGVSEWERLFLQPLTQQYESQVEQAQQAAQYDISQAYANYKRNQMRLMQQNIDTGAREQLGGALKSAYTSAYGQAQKSLASNISSVTKDYQEALAANQQQIQDIAGRLQEFTALTLEKGGLGDLSKAELAGQGYLKDVGDGTYEITNKLRNLYQQQLYSKGTETLEDYIRATSDLEGEKLESLIDDLFKYQNLLNESMGLEAGQRVVDKNLQYGQALSSAEAPKIGTRGTQELNVTDFGLIFDWGGKGYNRSDKRDKLAQDVVDYANKLGVTDSDLGFNLSNKVKQIVDSAASMGKDAILGVEGTAHRSHKWAAFRDSYQELIKQIQNIATSKYSQYK